MPTSAPPAGPAGKKQNRQRIIIYAGAGIAVLLLLFLRGQGGGGGGGGTQPTTTPPTTDSTGVPAGAGADNSAFVSALGDQVSQGLGGVSTALEDQSSSFNQLASALTSGTTTLGGTTTGSAGTPGVTTTSPQLAGTNQALKQLSTQLGDVNHTIQAQQQRQAAAHQQARQHHNRPVSGRRAHRKGH